MDFEVLRPIRAFLPISPRLATAGQPQPEQFPLIAQAGFHSVINLIPVERSLENEAQIVAESGMDYVHIPVEWTAPTHDDLQAFFDAMEVRRDQNVFVHCAANMRVSAFMFLWRVLHENADFDHAEDDLLCVWTPEGRWAELISEALETDQKKKAC